MIDVFHYGKQHWDFSRAQSCTDAERIQFVAEHMPDFETLNGHPNNEGYGFGMFTILTQHIKGRSVRDLVDAGIYAASQANATRQD